MLLFEIEYTFVMGGRAYVFARQLGDERDWVLGEGATLGGCPIRPELSMPRALDPEGKLRFDLFAFVLVRSDDLHRIEVGQRVALLRP